MKNFLRSRDASKAAAALIIVLAFVVLLTGLALAYFSRATTDRQLAESSYNDTSADLLARSALDIVIGDFQQEIVNGSTATSVSGTTIYIPTDAAKVVPVYYPTPAPGTTPAIANLIRRSVYPDGILGPAVASRASAVNSTANASANGRSISLARWNSHYLVPKLNSTDVGSDPITTAPGFPTGPNYWAPDWVIVTRAGPTPCASWPPDNRLADATSTNYAIGRYAYAVYDEGGLLDINVAGFPTPVPATPIPAYAQDIGRKAVLAWADLTALPTPTPMPSPTPTPGPSATASPIASPTPTPLGLGPNPAAFAVNRIVGFRNYATTGQNAVSNWVFPFRIDLPTPHISKFINYFLGGFFLQPKVGINRDFGVVNPNPTPVPDGRTDQNFVTRAELINFFKSAFSNNVNNNAPFGVNQLQYLGTFSREQNKPTLPLTPAWTSPRIVLPERFYLGNLDCVQSSVPGGCDIHTNFGLQMGPNGRWQYVGQTGSSLLSAIPTPAPGGSPAPEFFQILNYAYSSPSPTPTIDRILSLGASIIDLYDCDQPSCGQPNKVVTGIEYAPSLAWGAEPPATPTPIPMGTPPIPTPTPIPIAGYTPPSQLQLQPLQAQRFQNSGEMGYAYNPISTRPITAPTLDFMDAPPPIGTNVDAYLLDFFTYNKAPVRSGIVNLNTRQVPVLAALLSLASSQSFSAIVGSTQARAAGNAIVTDTTVGTIANPALSRADIARFGGGAPAQAIYGVTGGNEEQREIFARALSETTQTRTWGLLIDVVAQTGHYKPNATGLADFVVEGEKRYWLHIAIDRFDGTIVGQQLEEVVE